MNSSTETIYYAAISNNLLKSYLMIWKNIHSIQFNQSWLRNLHNPRENEKVGLIAG